MRPTEPAEGTPAVAGPAPWATPEGIVRSSALVGLGTALSRVTGFVRLAAIAYAIGFTRLTDTYNLANTTPNIVYELLLGGVLSAPLVRVFVDHLEDDDDEATSAVVTMAAVALTAITVTGILLAPWIVRMYTLRLEGADAIAQEEVATNLLRLLMPQMLFYGMTALITALLHARRSFAAPAFTPVLNNTLVAAMFFALPSIADGTPTLGRLRGDDGLVWLLGLGTTAGIVAMTVGLWPALRRAGVRLRPVFSPRHPAVRAVLRLSGWTVGYAGANQAALWVVLVLANDRAGAVAAYQGAFVFFQLPHGLFAVSLMTTIAPDLASAARRVDFDAFRERFRLGIRLLVLVVLPAVAGYLLLARPIVAALLERGAFSGASARATGDVLQAFAVGLLPFSLYLFTLRAFVVGLGDTRTPFVINLFENALNIGFALALEPSLGVEGLALAYALAYSVAVVVALGVLGRRVGGLGLTSLGGSFARMLTAAGALAGAVLVIRATVGAETGGGALTRTLVAVVAGAAAYLGSLVVLRAPELGLVRSRGGRAVSADAV
ncbi:MAG TPA: murein biosynthesis integral membrane protein MurJ [Acidimicrobiia bacterium]|nr:murein biosynthesis integral membrane protein MurJ [Acidimicrobiia bacterium]